MIEKEIYEYIKDNISDVSCYWGKLDVGAPSTCISFFKLPSFSSQITPSYLDVFQISVFSDYVDTATTVANRLISLFQLKSGVIGDYRVWVNNITNQGQIYDEEDRVQIILELGIKYTGI